MRNRCTRSQALDIAPESWLDGGMRYAQNQWRWDVVIVIAGGVASRWGAYWVWVLFLRCPWDITNPILGWVGDLGVHGHIRLFPHAVHILGDVPAQVISLVGGLIFGAINSRFALRRAFVFSLAFFVTPLIVSCALWIPRAMASQVYAALCIPTCVGAAWIVSRGRRRRDLEQDRLAKRLCAPCGYDLTGNESGICPECGTPIQRTP